MAADSLPAQEFTPTGRPAEASAVGRLAPSPTGALHLGNARSFLIAWLHARLAGARLLLRIEDLDGPRIKPWAVAQIVADLTYLGLDWDAETARQTARADRYQAVFEKLWRQGLLYPCDCTRREAEAAASAPHAGDWSQPYPQTCRPRAATLNFKLPWPAQAEPWSKGGSSAGNRAPVFRLRLPADLAPIEFGDQFAGPQRFEIARLTGDFVAAKSPPVPAYQLAVVIDDADDGVNQVVRGDDLLPSTALQIHLQRLLELPTPAYLHLPLLVGPDGRRLAKRHGDTRLAHFRERGIAGARIVGVLAQRSGLVEDGAALTAAELLAACRSKLASWLPRQAAASAAAAPTGVPSGSDVAAWLRSILPHAPMVITAAEIVP
ncbi:MAG: tRNA glutamyl-Q(34) synthetase GluQRS [Planctomycetota bacterium]